MCISKCTGDEFTVHSMGCNYLGELTCLECGEVLVGVELKKDFEERFDYRGIYELAKLRKLAGAVKRIANNYPQVAEQLKEACYFTEPPVNAVDHDQSKLVLGRHFYSQKHEQ